MKNILFLSALITSNITFANCADFTGNWKGQCEKTSNGVTENYQWEFPISNKQSCSEIEILGTKLKIGDVTVLQSKDNEAVSTTHYAVKFWGVDKQSLNVDVGYNNTYFKNGRLDKTDFGWANIILDRKTDNLDITIFENNNFAGNTEVKCKMQK